MGAQTGEGRGDRRGVFVPAGVLVVAGIVAAGVGMAALAALYPVLGLPIGVGTAVIGLLYGIYHNAHQRTALLPDLGAPPAAQPAAPSPAMPGGAQQPGSIRRGGEGRG